MIQTETKTIGDLTFEITQLGFTPQRKIFLLLSKTLGPGLAKAFSPTLTGKADPAVVAEGITELLGALNESDLQTLSEAFGGACRLVKADGKRPVFHPALQEITFSGQMLAYFKWLAACVEHNFSDFFDALRGLNVGAPDREEAE